MLKWGRWQGEDLSPTELPSLEMFLPSNLSWHIPLHASWNPSVSLRLQSRSKAGLLLPPPPPQSSLLPSSFSSLLLLSYSYSLLLLLLPPPPSFSRSVSVGLQYENLTSISLEGFGLTKITILKLNYQKYPIFLLHSTTYSFVVTKNGT